LNIALIFAETGEF